MHTRKTLLTVAAVAALSSTAACGGGSSTSANSGGNGGSGSNGGSTSSSSSMNASAKMVGPGCAAYAKAVPNGPGSVKGMAQDPVATAASHNPLLKTLVAAASGKVNPKVNLVDTLNSGQFTVFAPTDKAFGKVPAATMKKLTKDPKLLKTILTYHVIPGQLSPAQIDGKHKTVEGDTVKVAGSGNHLTVNGSSHVICGGVKTANATVYLVDHVLNPPM
ncbi:MAG: fasciclin domain-containing protein [Marmoricola sp.]